MPSQSFKIRIAKNEGLIMSPSELIEFYFFGIPLKSADGKQFPEHVLKSWIRYAQEEIEGYLNLKLTPQIIEERHDFNRQDYSDWGFIRCSYPVVSAIALTGNINNVEQVVYPVEWLSARKTNDNTSYFRNLYTVPSGATAAQYSGVMPVSGYFGAAHIPNYWKATYYTGFSKTPSDILNAVGKMASINLFHVMGDIILGAGIASQSIGIDGLSQSISSTSSATNSGYGSRIVGYLTDLKTNIPRLKAKYDGFNMTSL
jgi:hypothetical protein